jgi:hypothetical protein
MGRWTLRRFLIALAILLVVAAALHFGGRRAMRSLGELIHGSP